MAEINNHFGQGHNVYDENGNWVKWVEDSPDNQTLIGTNGYDFIRNEGTNVVIWPLNGNDKIDNYGSQVDICGTDGSKNIYNKGNDVCITNGLTTRNGSRVYNDGSKVTIGFGWSDDVIENHGENVTIYSGGGDDKVDNYASNVSIYSGAHIYHGSGKVETGAEGKDVIYNQASNVYIDVGKGNDSIHNFVGGDHTTIVGTDGKDSVWNQADDVSIDSGEGDNYILNAVYNGSKFLPTHNVKIITDSGNDLVDNYGTFAKINVGNGNNKINNYGSYTKVHSGDGDDEVYNDALAGGVDIDAGNGNNKINNYGSVAQIVSGTGKDEVENHGDSVDISTGSEADKITNIGGKNVNIKPGKGDDTVILDGISPVTVTYFLGDGHDVIYGTTDKTVLILPTKHEFTTSGNDIVYKMSDGGTITLKDFKGISVETADGKKSNTLIQNIPSRIDEEAFRKKIAGFVPGTDDLSKWLASNKAAKDILDKGADSEYLCELDPKDRQQIANFLKQAKENAELAKDLKDPERWGAEDYKQWWLSFFGTIKDTVDFLNDIGIFPQLEETLKNNNISIPGLPSLSLALKAVWDGVSLATSLATYFSTNKDFNDRYPNAREEAWQEVIGHDPSLIDKLFNFPARWKVNEYIRDLDPERYDKRELARIEMEASIAVVLIKYVSPTGRKFVENSAGDLGVSWTMNLWKNLCKAKYLSEVRGTDFSSEWAEQMIGTGVGGPFEDFKNLLKGKFVSSSSSNLAEDYTTKSLAYTVSDNVFEDTASEENINNVTLTGGDVADTIVNSGDYVLVETYKGDDLITNIGDFSTVIAGEGNDTVSNIGDSVKIDGGTGNNDIQNSGSNVTVYSGTGDDYIENVGELVTINSGDGKDYIDNVGDSVKIDTGANDDDIENYGEYVTITSGIGADFIDNVASNVTVNTGDGNDTIYHSYGSNVSMTSGVGNDVIKIVNDEQATINAHNITLTGGKGNDTIYNNDLPENIIQYANGDGNDIIYGFSSTDTLSITSGKITSSIQSGNDFIIYIGSGSINLKNTAGSTLHLKLADGKNTTLKAEAEKSTWKIYGTTATYGTKSKILTKITGLKKGVTVDDLSLKDDTVTLSKKALGTSKVTISNGYTLALGDDVSNSTIKSTKWTISGTTSTYKATMTEGYTLSDDKKSVIYYANNSIKTLSTITGLKKGTIADDFSVNGSVISIANHALGTSKVAITGDYTLALADDITSPVITPADWSITDTNAIYKTENRVAGYTLASNKKSVIYKKAVASTNLVTVTGLKSGVSADDLTLSGKNVTVSANALGTSKVSISSGYNLVLGSDVTKSKTIAAGWNISGNIATYKTKKITAGYVLASNKKSITHNSASGGDVLTTVTGLKSSTVAKNIPINIKTKTVTLNKAALDTGTVSVSGDYKLALGSDVKNKSKTTAAHFEVSGTTAKYISTKITAGYSLATDKKSVSYISTTSGGGNLATITGLKKGTKATALSVSDNNVITISKAALAGKTITVSDGYTLALANNISAPVFTAAGWSVSGTTAKYNSEKIVAGYTLADDKKSVNYTKSLASKTLVTVTGLVSGTTADKLSLKDNTVTLSGNIIGSKGATVNGKGYEFVLSSSGKVTNAASNTSLTGSSGNDTLIGSKYADYISSGLGGSDYLSGGNGNDTLLGISDNCTLLGGNGNDYLSCDLEGSGSLVGGAGNDTLSACQGNVTLAGGKGNDVFKFVLNDNKNFNATITDYTVGQNKILLDSSVSISSTNVSGNDVILNVSNSTITLKNAKGKKITFVDENGKTTSNTYSKSSSANVSELWFTADDTNFSTSFAQIDSITKNGLADYSLGNVDSIADWTALTPNDSLTSGLTYSDK